MTIPIPVRILDILAHSPNKRFNGAHAVSLLWAAFDARQRHDAVIDDDTYLWAREGCTFEHWERGK